MRGTQAEIQRCQRAIQDGMHYFKNTNREMLASIPQDVEPALWAHIRLTPTLVQEMEGGGNLYDWRRYFEIFSREFLVLLDRGVLAAVPWTDAGLQNLYDLRRRTGIGAQNVPPPPKSAAELLEEQVLSDWQTCSTKQIRQKLNDPSYKAAFDRLDSAGKIGTQITSHVVAGEAVTQP